MSLPDLVNGLFEAFGAVSIFMNVMRVREHKQVRGVYGLATVFFTAWGFWNLFYYPHLGQWLSFAGGVLIVACNCAWLYYYWRYRKS